jgi:hypothetical protein
MASFPRLLFTGIYLCTSFTISAQSGLKKITAGKVIGKSMNEQKKWELKQLPRNSVLYKYQAATAPFDPVPHSLKKEKLQGINLPGKPQPVISKQPKIYLQSYLQQQRKQELPWKKKYWWSDTNINPPGKIYQDSKNN